MNGNIKVKTLTKRSGGDETREQIIKKRKKQKIRERFLSNPTANNTLQDLLATEAPEKKRVATEGLLWLTR